MKSAHIIAVLGCGVLSAAANTAPLLLDPEPSAPIKQQKALGATPAYVLRSRPANLNRAALPGPVSERGARTALNFFSDAASEVEWQSMDRHAAANFAWQGRLLDDPLASITLTVVDSAQVLDVLSPKHGHFQVRTRSDGTTEVRQFDSEKLKGNGQCCVRDTTSAATPKASSDELITAAVTAVTIDVLMVYTDEARDAAGGRSDIVAIAQAAINGENGNFSRSGIPHRMRLVHTRETTHSASGNLATELGWVAGNSTVADIRNEVGADVVAFLSDKDDYGMLGIAHQLSSTSGNSGQAFSANYYDTASGVWPHEVGHNLGAGHNEDRNDRGLYTYSSGHHWVYNSKEYGTIMSYIGTRIPYFSNPDVNWNGKPTGTSGRDNGRTIENTGGLVAGYKSSKTLVDPTLTISTSSSTPYELRPFNLTVTAINNGPSTATSIRIIVDLPSGLALVSHNGGSAFSTSSGVWSVPSLADDGRASLVLTVQPDFNTQGRALSTSCSVSSAGSGFVDFNYYNNSASVSVTPRPEPAVPVTLVSTGAVWRYFDRTNNLGTAWHSNTVNDANWSNGPAMLGFGDANGVLPATTIASNGQITAYFRRAFVVSNMTDAVSLQVRLQRDDGAVVYLNDAELWRDNMPSGTVGYLTLASSSISGTEETTWLTNSFSPAGLVIGTNLLAVEVHQNTNTSSDIAFNLEATLMVRTNRPPTVSLSSPSNGQIFGTVPARLTVTASASDPEGALDEVELWQGATLLGVFTNTPYSLVVSNLPMNLYTFSAIVTDDRGARATSAPVNITVAGKQTLVNTGAVWRFNDSGADLGSSWRANDFNDAAWPGGPALLGFGDANGLTPATLVASNGQMTTYFCRPFYLLNASRVTNLTARLLRDDGAVVYLNGLEVWRNNMPTNGPIDSLTPALVAISSAAEDDWHTNAALDPALLVSGTNHLAVEIHQNTNTSSDVAFDFALEVAYAGPAMNLPPDVALTSPADGGIYASTEKILLAADAAQPYGRVAGVEFFLNGTNFTEVTTTPYVATLENPPLGTNRLFAVATDDLGRSRTSAVARAVVLLGVSAPLIEPGAVWKFFDGTNDLGAVWRTNNFNDATWDSGPSELGFGDGNEATVLASNRQMTSYFRCEFFVPDASAAARLTARLLRDDAAAIYLNGVEVWRDNLPPSDALNYLTPALVAVAGAEEVAWHTNKLDPSLLVSGTNLLAVEIHQNATTSSDISFDLELIGLTVFPQAPRLEVGFSGSVPMLAWPAAAGALRLYSTTNLAAPDSWMLEPSEPVFTNGQWRILVPFDDGPGRFYRLQTP